MLACELVAALSGTVRPDDARRHAPAVQAFAAAAHAIIERACLWSPEDCRAAAKLVREGRAGFDKLRAVTLSLAAATCVENNQCVGCTTILH